MCDVAGGAEAPRADVCTGGCHHPKAYRYRSVVEAAMKDADRECWPKPES
jgi:hypothetical protein